MGVASGIAFISEVLRIEKLIGGAVIFVGVYLTRRR
jgi:drug/metabolite transporter (DMT)-like permease